jgi:hypothetical protein
MNYKLTVNTNDEDDEHGLRHYDQRPWSMLLCALSFVPTSNVRRCTNHRVAICTFEKFEKERLPKTSVCGPLSKIQTHINEHPAIKQSRRTFFLCCNAKSMKRIPTSVHLTTKPYTSLIISAVIEHLFFDTSIKENMRFSAVVIALGSGLTTHAFQPSRIVHSISTTTTQLCAQETTSDGEGGPVLNKWSRYVML